MGRNLVKIDANTINNSGTMAGDVALLKAKEDINVVGGTVSAVSGLLVEAGGDLNVRSTTQSSQSAMGSYSSSQTGIDRMAGLYVSGPAGVLLASAGGDMNLIAAQIVNKGDGITQLKAEGNVNLGTVKQERSENLNWSDVNYKRSSSSQDVGTTITAGGAVQVLGKNDVNLKAAVIDAAGKVSIKAETGNVLIEAGERSESHEEASQVVSRGFLSKTTTTSRSSTSSTEAVGSEIGGQTVEITAGQNLTVKGSSVIGDEGTRLKAGGDVNIVEAQNSYSSSSFEEVKKKGLLSGNPMSLLGGGISIGKQQNSMDAQNTSTRAAGSTVGSVNGNVVIEAGGTYTQRGSDVVTPQGDVDIAARKVNIVEARETSESESVQKSKQSGLTVALTGGVVGAAQTVQAQQNAIQKTESSRMQALGRASQAMAIASAVANPMPSLSVSIGSSRSTSTQTTQSDTARGSSVSAGGNVTIRATGAGEESDITVQGSSIDAGGKTRLKAEGDVALLAAANTTEEQSRQSSKSGSIGVSVSPTGAVGVNVSASRGKGEGNGESTSFTNTRVGGQAVEIESGGDTSLKGAVVDAKQVTAKVGGDLKIESLQDTETYKEKSQQIGGSVTVGAGAAGSVNASKTKINSTFASVAEQSGIRAGDGGFQVSVGGKTELIGGAITSTDKAIEEGKNTFESAGGVTTRDIENSANFKASSVAVSVGTSGGSAGMGKDSGNASSVTTAGISGIAGDTAKRTGDQEQGIEQIFDKQKVKDEVGAQVAITQSFGQQASKLVGDLGARMTKPIDEANKYLALQTIPEGERTPEQNRFMQEMNAQGYSPDKAQAALADPANQAAYENWKEGGPYRAALHSVVGGLTGGVSGALGAGASSASAPLLQQLQDGMKDALVNAGVDPKLAQGLAGAATGLTAAAGGALLTGGSVAGAVTSMNQDMNNRQLHPVEAKLIKDNARRYAQQRYGTDNPTPEQIQGAEIELANTAQNLVDNNLGVVVPKTPQAEAFLNQLKLEYAQATGSINIAGTGPGQPGGTQQLFYASTEQKNMPWLNNGLADAAVTGLIVRTPINPPKASEVVPSNRDRMTGLPLDEQGRYAIQVSLDGQSFSPKYYPCATAECVRSGGSLDMSDPGTQAYVKALDQKVFKDIGTGLTIASLVTPVGPVAEALFVLGIGASAGQALTSDTFVGTARDEALKVLSEKGGEKFFTEVLGHTPSAAARATAIINLSGGWDAFVNRLKIDLLGIQPDDKKK